MKDNWNEILAQQVKAGYDRYKTLRLDLSVAHLDYHFPLAGDFIYVEKVSSDSAFAQIKLNRLINDSINLYLHTKIKTMVTGFYLTNDAQAGEWIELVIGCQFEVHRERMFKAGPAQPAEVITNALANTNTVGPNQICNRALIKADVNNTQTAWVDFQNAAVQNACFPLDPHEAIRVRLDNLNQINVNFEVANENVFVVYEL